MIYSFLNKNDKVRLYKIIIIKYLKTLTITVVRTLSTIKLKLQFKYDAVNFVAVVLKIAVGGL